MRLVDVRTLKNNEITSIPVMTMDGRTLLPMGAKLT